MIERAILYGVEFLKLPIKFYNGDHKQFERDSEILGLPEDKLDLVDGYIYVNPKQIISCNKSSENKDNLTVISVSGDSYMIQMDFDEWFNEGLK